MKYFTKEELEDITNELLQEPTRETLKNLNNKYNKEEKVELPVKESVFNPPKESVANSMPSFEVPTFNSGAFNMPKEEPVNTESIPVSTPSFEVPAFNAPSSPAVEETPQMSTPEPVEVSSQKGQVPSNLNIPNMNQTEAMPNLQTNNFEVPTPVLEPTNYQLVGEQIPKLDNQVVNNQSNEPVNFSGNLYQQSTPEPTNLMDTTDNFKIDINSTTKMNSGVNTNLNSNPFFGNPVNESNQVNNPIPVGGQTRTGPSMFGQIMQNNQ